MTDMVSPERRSRIMAQIKGFDTRPEVLVRRVLHRLGYRFRLHARSLPGKPDIVLPRHKTVVLVHGCFWHGHRCADGHKPKSNTAYWDRKLEGNKKRDSRNKALLRRAGWRPVVVWSCQCTSEAELERIIRKAMQKR